MKTIPKIRWWICGLLLLLNLVNNLDRQVFALVGPLVQRDLKLDEISFGRMVALFQATFAITNLFAGRLVDQIGVRLGAGLAILWFSVAQVGHILARGAVGLGLARAGLGIGESPIYPATLKGLSEWFTPAERGFAAGWVHFGVMVGPVFAPALVPWMASNWGWRSPFVFTGVLGFLLVIPWFWLYRRPEQHPRIGGVERAKILAGRLAPARPEPVSWFKLFRRRQLWTYVVIQAVVNPAWWFFIYWLPKFMGEVFGIRGVTMAPYLMTVYAMAAVGAVAGGSVSGALIKRGVSINAARKYTLLLCGLLMPAVMIAAHTSVAWIAVLLIGGAAVIHQTWTVTGAAILSDLFPDRAVASVAGIASLVGSSVGVIAAEIIGHWLQGHPGQYAPMFVYSGCAYLLATALVQVLSPRLEPALKA